MIRRTASDEEVDLGAVRVETGRRSFGATDYDEFTIRAEAGSFDETRIANFLYFLEARTRDARIVELDLERTGPSAWRYRIVLATRASF